MNPNFTNSSQMNPTMAVNDDKHHAIRQFNTFNMDYEHSLTARFGDETPFYVFDTWAKDKVPFGSFHEMRTEVIESPLMSKINMHKSYFSVPYPAIYPRNWDNFITNPTQGDDVPTSIASSVFSSISVLAHLKALCQFIKNQNIIPNENNLNAYFNILLRYYFMMEAYFSRGSLLNLMGCKLSKYIKYDLGNLGIYSFDRMAERFFEKMRITSDGDYDWNINLYYNVDPSDGSREFKSYSSLIDTSSDDTNYISFHRLLELCRDNTDFEVEFSYSSDAQSSLNDVFNALLDMFTRVEFINVDYNNLPINHSRLIAYQLIAAHFVSNDSVDFVYSADKWRSKINSFLYGSDPSTGGQLFSSPIMYEYNGSEVLYDDYSGEVMNRVWSYFFYDVDPFTDGDTLQRQAYHYLYELHRFCKSLKFGDYFNGARPEPYAVGDMSAPVVNNGVSAIDMTKNIQMQRFLAAVNKTGRKVSDYFKGLTGTDITPRITDPKFLARDSQVLGAQEIENTANQQGNVVTLLRSENSKFAFEVDITDPAILIGTLSFSVKRPYCNTIERFFFHRNRFDFFNPYMQYTGDQQIYAAEKYAGNLSNSYAYQMRYAEYKQRVSQVSGAFVDFLKGWLFIADNKRDLEDEPKHISPESIRSCNSEFDQFLPSSMNCTPAGYFHFVFRFDNISSPNRNMDATPSIL